MKAGTWLRRLSSAGLVLLGILPVRAAAAQSQQGSITVHVTEVGTGRPIDQAQVSVVGTTLGGLTNAEGQVNLRGVPAGAQQVRVLRVGYGEQKKPVTVVAGEQATVTIEMTPMAVQLSEVVTTATGEQRRLEVGNATAKVDAANIVETKPITNMSDLLVARAPGVQVLPGNMTGTGGRVRIRGSNSLSLSNDPIYIIDGIRMQSATNSTSIGIGGSTPSRVNDIDPNDIESIEVVKGPSAATLYGTDAANGVIVITTKKGQAGKPQWQVYAEQGLIQDRNDYFDAYTNFGHNPTDTLRKVIRCTNATMSKGSCVSDSLLTFNLFKNPETTPFGNGYRQQYGLQLRGGTDAVRYFVAGNWADEMGVVKIPEFDVQRLNAAKVPIKDEWMHPNAAKRWGFRTNLNVALSPKADLAINTGYTSTNQRLPQTDNNTVGLLSSAYGGPGYRNNGTAAVTGAPLNGYRAFTPGDIFQETVTQGVDRFIGGLTGSWRPTSWLSGRANLGVDFTDRVDSDVCRRGECVGYSTSYRQGFKTNNRTNMVTYTVDAAAAATFSPRDWMSSKTTAGVQYVDDRFERNGASSENLPPGASTVDAGAVQYGEEATTLARTLGAFVEQQVGIHDRLFITGGLRADNNSAFGSNLKAAYYPKASASWILSDEPFFSAPRWLNQLRLRTAYGSSGNRPGTNAALRYFVPTKVNIGGVDMPALQYQSLGNLDLKPETSTEFEAGFDGRLLSNRVSVEVTYYNKKTKDALVQRVLPPSLGSGATSRFENLGAVRNRGFEALITAQLIDQRKFGWDVSLNGSTNTNKLLDLGGVPPIIGATTRQLPGYALNGYWARPILGYSDKNSDGFITADELTIGDSAVYLGSSMPRYEAVLSNGFDLFNRRVRINGQLDYKGGFKLLNDTERIRCQSRNNCRGLNDPSAPFSEQARVVALRDHSSQTQAGFMEDADFIRLRELSLTFTAPERWASAARARGMNVTFAARNIWRWTKYSGLDPESNYGQYDLPVDFQTAPPPTYFTVRVNLNY